MTDVTSTVVIDMVFDAVEQKQHCENFVQGYKHDEATISQAQVYADCIHTLYPKESSSQGTMLALIILPLILIVFIVFIKFRKGKT